MGFSTDTKQDFLKLPREIRDMVYRNLVPSSEHIDIWPIMGKHYPDDKSSCKTARMRARTAKKFKAMQRLSARTAFWDTVFQNEVADIFYGSNTFRFTGANAWVLLAFFLHTIGPAGARKLRHIQISGLGWGPGALWVGECDITSQDALKNRRQEGQLLDAVRVYEFLRIPPQYGRRNGLSYVDRAFEDCVEWLKPNNKLRKVDVLVPSWWGEDQFDRLGNDDTWYSEAKKLGVGRPELDFSIVRLRRRTGNKEWISEVPHNDFQLRIFRQAVEKGWSVKDAVIEADGKYDVKPAEKWWPDDWSRT